MNVKLSADTRGTKKDWTWIIQSCVNILSWLNNFNVRHTKNVTYSITHQSERMQVCLRERESERESSPQPAGLPSCRQARWRGPPESALSPRSVQESAGLPTGSQSTSSWSSLICCPLNSVVGFSEPSFLIWLYFLASMFRHQCVYNCNYDKLNWEVTLLSHRVTRLVIGELKLTRRAWPFPNAEVLLKKALTNSLDQSLQSCACIMLGDRLWCVDGL